MKTPSEALERIAQNIQAHGYHVYVVAGGPAPRWAYTIRLSPKTGFELVLAGGAVYSKDDVLEILRRVVVKVGCDRLVRSIDVPDLDTFRLEPTCENWSNRLLLGANHYYQTTVEALQLVPDRSHRTIDVPDLSRPLARTEATPWR